MISFLLGVATFAAAVKFKKPLRKAAVAATSQVIGLIDHSKTAAFGIKEELEDIVAEAQYENMKKNISHRERDFDNDSTEDDE